MTTASQVSKLYHTVVDDVINNVKEAFLDEGVDEQVLQELKQLWESKLAASKALEPPPQEPEVLPTTANLRMPQPLHSTNATANNTSLAATDVQGNQTQQVTAGAAVVQAQQPRQYQPTAAAQAAAMALPAGLFRQHIATLGAGGQIQNIAVQQTGNGQYITLPQFAGQAGQPQPLAIRPQQTQQQLQGAAGGQPIRIPIQTQQQIHIRQQQPGQQQTARAQIFHAGQLLQQPIAGKGTQGLSQLDGAEDTSSSEDEDEFEDDKEEEEKEDENEEEEREEEDPLNSDDDVSEEDPTELFDTENVVVCQFDKINRNKNKWKFYLKDGIMNLNGRDFVFQKATGDSEW